MTAGRGGRAYGGALEGLLGGDGKLSTLDLNSLPSSSSLTSALREGLSSSREGREDPAAAAAVAVIFDCLSSAALLFEWRELAAALASLLSPSSKPLSVGVACVLALVSSSSSSAQFIDSLSEMAATRLQFEPPPSAAALRLLAAAAGGGGAAATTAAAASAKKTTAAVSRLLPPESLLSTETATRKGRVGVERMLVARDAEGKVVAASAAAAAAASTTTARTAARTTNGPSSSLLSSQQGKPPFLAAGGMRLGLTPAEERARAAVELPHESVGWRKEDVGNGGGGGGGGIVSARPRAGRAAAGAARTAEEQGTSSLGGGGRILYTRDSDTDPDSDEDPDDALDP